jgi:hypothetical protein
MNQSRRRFASGLALLGAGNALGLWSSPAAAEPPPETRRIRLVRIPSICRAPQYVADDLLRGQGFADIEYVPKAGGGASVMALAAGEADISMNYSGPVIVRIAAGDPLVVLAGAHIGCFELFGTDRVRSIRDLKGKTVAVIELDGSEHIFLNSMAAYVGLDPRKDIHFVAHPVAESIQLLAEGKIDAFLGFPPYPPGAAGEEDRPLGGQQHRRPAVVPVLLLCGDGEPGVRSPPPCGDKAGAPRHPDGQQHLCARARAGSPSPGGLRIHQALRLRSPDAEGHPLQPVAGLPSGRYLPLLRPAPPRGRNHQGEPQQADRPGGRLAVPQRAEEGTEGVARVRHRDGGLITVGVERQDSASR